MLSANSIVLAQSLYKWTEPDGSITFSVTPPEAGIRYETLSAPEPASTASLSDTEKTDKVQALQQVLPDTAPTKEPTQRLAPQQSVQSVSRQGNSREQGIRTEIPARYRASQDTSIPDASASQAVNRTQITGERSAAMTARSRKQRQCEDLRKRVVSLERRLKTRLTPEDMDNTVIHMARYQRSYDQHCVQ